MKLSELCLIILAEGEKTGLEATAGIQLNVVGSGYVHVVMVVLLPYSTRVRVFAQAMEEELGSIPYAFSIDSNPHLLFLSLITGLQSIMGWVVHNFSS